MALTVGTNSWVTLIEANDYLSEKFNASAWTSLTNAEKEQCLITAYRWVQRLTAYNIPASSTLSHVKYAQIELAWYVYSYYDSHIKRDALYDQGVRDFKISKWEETLVESRLPRIVSDLLEDELTAIGGYFPVVNRDLSE